MNDLLKEYKHSKWEFFLDTYIAGQLKIIDHQENIKLSDYVAINTCHKTQIILVYWREWNTTKSKTTGLWVEKFNGRTNWRIWVCISWSNRFCSRSFIIFSLSSTYSHAATKTTDQFHWQNTRWMPTLDIQSNPRVNYFLYRLYICIYIYNIYIYTYMYIYI